jgi:hypothetical protein
MHLGRLDSQKTTALAAWDARLRASRARPIGMTTLPLPPRPPSPPRS